MSERRLDYLDNPNHQRIEVGNVNSSDIALVVQRAPLTHAPANFSISFRRSEGVVPGSYGKVHCVGDRLWMGEVHYTQDMVATLNGGRLEVLRADIPRFEEGIEGLFDAGALFESFKPHAKEFEREGYTIDPSSFRIFNYVAKSSGGRTGFFTKAITGKIIIATESMVQGEEARKLVLLYTSDMTDTPEFKTYQNILEDIKKSKVAA
ncbi:MAG: hypothetical protein AABX10_04820 [Nanoarchaeota archaeon]